jgi:hypothetical protein
MISKNKSSLIFMLILFLLLININAFAAKKRGVYATKNLIGQAYYMNRCSSCHGEGNRGGNMASIREWKSIFSNEAAELIDIHTEDDELLKLLEYMKSVEFKKKSELMLPFLQEFAYDSEHIPTCN